MRNRANQTAAGTSRGVALVLPLIAAIGLAGCWGSAVETGAEAIYHPVNAQPPVLPDPAQGEPSCLADSDCASLATKPCVAAICDAKTKRCELGIRPDHVACDDGDPCTAESTCNSGTCQALQATDCDDGNPCSSDDCDPATGCTHADKTLAPCTDGNPCTVGDHCDGGACVAELNVCDCTKDADCAEQVGGDKCVGLAQCSGGLCAIAPGTPTKCDDNNPCTIDTCDPETGACSYDAAADGNACSDGDICTLAEHCVGGACTSTTSLPCAATDTGCVTGSCDAQKGCVVSPDNDGAPCDDGNSCTQGDTCKTGICGGKSVCDCTVDADCAGDAEVPACLGVLVCRTGHCEVDANLATPCAATTDACTMSLCTAQGCVVAQTPPGGPCDDGTACTIGDSCAGTGVCQSGIPLHCDDDQACTADLCLPSSGCLHGPGKNGDPCNDGNSCTTADKCAGLVCTGSMAECDDDNACTTDLCDPNNSGKCLHKAMASGVDCDDGDACTSGERCVAGECLGKDVIDCDDGNPCTADTCTTDSKCIHNPVEADSDATCDDGDGCTIEDACVDGLCTGKPGNCQCQFDKDCIGFEDGNACNGTLMCMANKCVIDPSTVVTCPDLGAPCVTVACQPKTGLCAETPKTSSDGDKIPCDDGNACTQFEVCLVGGVCGGGTPLVCDDGDLCTADLCEPLKGCTTSPVDGSLGLPCDDGNACTKGDSCGDGGCVPGPNVCQCTKDADCAAYDDGDICNGGLVCKQGACLPDGTAVVCDPSGGGLCTEVKCLAKSGKCELINKLDGSDCSDQDKCASGGLCQAGVCIGSGKPACDDGDGCTKDSCDPVKGCSHVVQVGLFCDDGNACTAGQSCGADGTCGGGQNICECQQDADCPDDNDLCNGVPACLGNKCQAKAGSAVVCDASGDGPCQANTCQAATGKCTMVKQPDKQVCDDGSACTTGELCSDGACAGGVKVVCDDDNICTADGCNPAQGCFHLNNQSLCDDGDACTLGDICQGGECTPGAGTCECEVNADCVAKDDGNLCNGVLTCQGGKCALDPSSIVQCDPSNNTSCTANLCDEKTGKCAPTPFPDGTQCGDGDVCTSKDQCVGGTCKGTPFDCDDDNPCSTDVCDPATGCKHSANTLPCDDGNPCTDGDVCAGGSCTAGKDTCGECKNDVDCAAKDDGNLCNGVLQCVAGACQPKPNSAVICPDTGNPCTNAVCQPATGNCNNESVKDGGPCDDGSACTATSACFGGVCIGQNALDCDDGKPCTADKCDAKTGCVNTPTLGPCSDGNPCTTPDICLPNGSCQGGINTCECTSNADCVAKDDGNPCNGTLICQANACVVAPGSPVVCDGNKDTECAKQTCDPDDGQCKAKPVIDGTDCNDGSLCTVGDTCSKGACTGSALVCADANPCTTDDCDSATGCVNKPDDGAACDDGNPCTQQDSCQGGACAPGPNNCQCQVSADCAKFEDDSLCNGTLICSNNTCVIDPKTVVTCPPGNGCSTSECNAKTGACDVKPAGDGTPCGGATLCGGTGQCTAGKCVGPHGCADDGNPCTAQSCDGQGKCLATPVNGPCSDGDSCTIGDQCADGACKPGANQCDCKVDGDCVGHDDGDVCNGIFTCQNSKCAFDASTVVKCPPGAGSCQTDACNPKDGTCSIANEPNGTPCPDGDECTTAEQCFAGACLKKGITCDDGKECTDDACDPQKGCVFNNSLPKICDDGDPCTPISLCFQGTCNPGPINTCVCTQDSDCPQDNDKCNGEMTCQGGNCKVDPGSVVNCDPGNSSCLKVQCTPATGKCDKQASPDGTPCSDDNLCTTGDGCVLGLCVGAPIQCDDKIDCTMDVCVPASGCDFQADSSKCDDNKPCTNDVCNAVIGCLSSPQVGAPCDDGDACTAGDICVTVAGGMVCQPGVKMNCDDGDVCTADSCQSDGGCVHQPTNGPCDDGNPCTTGDVCGGLGPASCAGKPKDCGDNNPCTADSCTTNNGLCSHVPAPGPCDDGDACTTGDICIGGGCQGGDAKVCNDGNPCTDDACDAQSGGCVATPNTNPCDDGDICTTGDACSDGGCKGGANQCECKTTADCAGQEDGDLCNGTLICQANKCVLDPNSVVDCSAVPTPPCKSALCMPKTGQCVLQNDADGNPCSDNSACTANDKCTGGACSGQVIDCGKSETCIERGCDPSQGCFTNNKDGDACDDGDACTQGDTCSAGKCTGKNACQCKTDADCKPFDGNDKCKGTHICTANQCVIDPKTVINCQGGPSSPCVQTICDPPTGNCFKENEPDGTPCDDGTACTTPDSCTGGVCGGAKVDCDDANACTNDICDASAGCLHQSATGTPCDDGDNCTSPDVCQAGSCAPGPDVCACKVDGDCDDGKACTVDVCTNNQCTSGPANGIACEDDDKCTGTGECVDGACKPGAFNDCDDNYACTTDSCDAATGACKNEVIYGCCTKDKNCDDKNDCTADSCKVDACPDGVLQDGRCYKVISQNSTWFEAQDACLAWGGQLVSIGSKADNDFVRGLGNQAGCSDVWIGFNDLAKDDTWVWSDGSPANYDNWADGEPNECENCCGSPEDVAEMWTDGTWNDICLKLDNPCMVCEKSLGGGTCSNQPVAGCCKVDADCEDGDACSIDTCVAGKCQAVFDPTCCKGDVDCDDSNPCTNDVCDAGKCLNAPNNNPCDDGDPCTDGDTCAGGSCQSGTNTCQCKSDADCAKLEDGNVCNGTLVCNANKCIIDPGTIIDCSGQVDETCGTAICNPQTGHCSKKQHPNGSPCDDKSLCTSADSCFNGKCTGDPLQCNDSNVCTADSCNAALGCQHVPTAGLCDDGNKCTSGDLCQGGKCVGGANVCQCQGNADCAKLEDGNLCNGTLICSNNQCVVDAKTVVVCDTKGDTPCKTTACVMQTGQCQTTTLPNGASCDDGNACTISDLCKSGGLCSGINKSCNDSNTCTQDSCDPANGCVNTPLSSIPCNDGNNCTTSDTCKSGKCEGTPTACECKSDADCADKEDGNFCNGTLKCVDQACQVDPTTVVDCSHLTDPPCGKYACQQNTGQCLSKSLPNGTPCSDDNECTSSDACQGGLCQGTPKSCADSNPCSNDSCNTTTGECQFIPATGQPCDDGDACTNDDACDAAAKCVGKNSNCDDGNQCTFDVCQAGQGCLNVPTSGPCDDGDPCTVGEKCDAGACTAGPKNPSCCASDGDCDDLDKCSVDTCKNNDCERAPVPCTDDGSPCTIEACKDGSCSSTTPPSDGAVTLYAEDFDDGQPNGLYVQNTNKDVTWQILAGKSASQPNAFYYGNTKSMDYDYGQSMGDVMLPPVQLPASGQASFSIDYQLLVNNNGCSRDKIQLYVNGVLQVGQLCSSTLGFQARTWSLNNFIGQVVQITLRFTTVDETSNKGEGAYIDNLKIQATGAADCCQGPQDCDDGQPCTLDACDSKSGKCSNPPNPGGSCDDGNKCTDVDLCNDQGQCAGKDVDCDDGSACTKDSCNAATGLCVNAPYPGFKANFSDGVGGLTTTSTNPLISWQTSKKEYTSAPSSLYIGNINPLTGTHSYNFGPVVATAALPTIFIPAGVSTAFWRFRLKYDRDPGESTTCNSLADRVAVTVQGQIPPNGQLCQSVPLFIQANIPLDSVMGQTVNLGFAFFANQSQNNGQGAWIDDIEVGWTCN